MATTIRISTGPLTAERVFQDDVAAQAILIRCADNIGAEGTNPEKLLAIVDWCVRQIQGEARSHQISLDQAALIANADAENKLT